MADDDALKRVLQRRPDIRQRYSGFLQHWHIGSAEGTQAPYPQSGDVSRLRDLSRDLNNHVDRTPDQQ